MLKAVRAIFGATLVMAAVSACSDDPLSEGREDGAYFKLNPTVAVVNAGGTTVVSAVVVNRYGGAIDAPVTGTPCDARITAAVDATRDPAFEPPERFTITGATLGESCLVVSGGGVTDTITVQVVPASIQITGDSLLSSGEQSQLTVTFLNAAGAPVTGMTVADVEFTVDPSSAAVVDAAGVVSAQAPGEAVITATLVGAANRSATKPIAVVAGTFAGTFTPANPQEGRIMTINAGALQFDDDTDVLVGGVAWPWVLSVTPDAITLAAPESGDIVISNIGPNQVALNATIPLVVTEGLDNGLTTNRVLAETDSMWFSLGGTDDLDLAQLVVPAGGGTYRFTLDWLPSASRDLDIIFFNSAGAFMGYGAPYGGCATGARPEGCTVPLTEGTWYPAVNLYSGDPTTAKLTITRQ